MPTKQQIRDRIWKTYGTIATQGEYRHQTATETPGCCSGSQKERPLSGCGCGTGPIDPGKLSGQLGYSKEDLRSAPQGSNLGLGCGNPKAIAGIKPGETIIDLGSGAGFDCFLAAKETGRSGRVIGVDMTPEMISRSRENAAKTDLNNVEFRLGEIEHLPVANDTADLIISNCVINLSTSKQQVFKEAFRALKNGGRMAVSDILTVRPLPESIKKDLALISACIGGAASIDETDQMLKNAGFVNIKISPVKISQDLIDEWSPGSKAGEYIVSAYIEAEKPLHCRPQKKG